MGRFKKELTIELVREVPDQAAAVMADVMESLTRISSAEPDQSEPDEDERSLASNG